MRQASRCDFVPAQAAWWTEGGPRRPAPGDRKRPARGKPLCRSHRRRLGCTPTRRRSWRSPAVRILRDVRQRHRSGHRPGPAAFAPAQQRMPARRSRLNEDAYVNRPDLGLWAVRRRRGRSRVRRSCIGRGREPRCRPSTRASLPAKCSSRYGSRLEAGACASARRRLAAWRRRDGGDDGGRPAGARRPFRLPVGGRFRAYLLRGHALTKITRDHSLVQDLVESGTISEAEATDHPQANIITRAVGADSDVLELEKRTGQLMPGDRLLLCSDGCSRRCPRSSLQSCFPVMATPAPNASSWPPWRLRRPTTSRLVTIDVRRGRGIGVCRKQRAGAAASTAPEATEHPVEAEPEPA